jgi:hypothetical protein
MAPRREDDGCPIGSDVRSASEIPEVSVVSSSTFLNAAGSRSPRLMISYTLQLQSNLAFDFGVQAERTRSRRLAASVHGQQRPKTSVSHGVAVPAYCCEFPKRAETSAATHRSHVLAVSSLFHSSHFICAHGRISAHSSCSLQSLLYPGRSLHTTMTCHDTRSAGRPVREDILRTRVAIACSFELSSFVTRALRPSRCSRAWRPPLPNSRSSHVELRSTCPLLLRQQRAPWAT